MKVHKHKHVTSDGTEIDLTVKSPGGIDLGAIAAIAFFILLAAMAIAGMVDAPASIDVPATGYGVPSYTPVPWGTILLSGLGVLIGLAFFVVGGIALLAGLQERKESRERTAAPQPSREMTERRTDTTEAPGGAIIVPLRKVS